MSSSELPPPSYPFPTSSTHRKRRSFLIAAVLSLVLLLSPAVAAKTLQRDVLALLALHTEVSSSLALSLTGRGSVDGRWKAAVNKWPVDSCTRAADGSVICSQDPCGNDWDGNGWEGITCRYQWDWPKDKPRVVTNIHLPKRGLGGEIPKSLALFRNITELDFDTNALSGALPPEWGCLSNLIEIDLSKNRFTGTVPAAWGNIPGLVEVELDSNTGLSGCVPYGMPPFERWCGGIAMLGSGGPNPCPAFTTDRLIGTSTTQTGIFYGSRCPKPSKPADVTCPSLHDEYFKELVNLFFKEHYNSDSSNDAADSPPLANDAVEEDAPVVWQAFSGTNAKASPKSIFSSLFGK